jgi:hypothetical protein
VRLESKVAKDLREGLTAENRTELSLAGKAWTWGVVLGGVAVVLLGHEWIGVACAVGGVVVVGLGLDEHPWARWLVVRTARLIRRVRRLRRW